MKIHFVGICGVSMRVLASILKSKGHSVTGSDLNLLGHSAENVHGAELVVYTGAVSNDNVELARAKELKIPIVERAKLLGRIAGMYENPIAIAGAHGKTTATGMLWKIFEPLDPTVHIGGSIKGRESNIGTGDYFITEACEYRRSFLHIFPSVAIILNIDLDHTDCYKDIDSLNDAFAAFVKQAKDIVIANGDDQRAVCLPAKNLVTFGFNDSCTYRANILSKDNNGRFEFRVLKKGSEFGCFRLSVAGKHNVYNALAAIACADHYGLNPADIGRRLLTFTGIDRRFEYIGRYNGANIYSDYAHHPSEIECTLQTARTAGNGSITAIFEPHTYTRTATFLDGFAAALMCADKIILLPVYAAREKNENKIGSLDIQRKIKAAGRDSIYFDTYAQTIDYLKSTCCKGETLIFLGAGDIDKAARLLAPPEI